MGESVELIDDEQRNEPQRGRKGPQLLAPQCVDQKNLDQSVTNKIDAGEQLGVERQARQQMFRRIGEPVVGLAQLVRHEPPDHGVERAQRHEQNQQAAYGFQNSVGTLDENRELEQPVQALAAFRL